jgi:hypothetical protein
MTGFRIGLTLVGGQGRVVLSVPSLRSLTFEDGTDNCPETSVKDYHSTLLNIPKERRSHERTFGSATCGECLDQPST